MKHIPSKYCVNTIKKIKSERPFNQREDKNVLLIKDDGSIDFDWQDVLSLYVEPRHDGLVGVRIQWVDGLESSGVLTLPYEVVMDRLNFITEMQNYDRTVQWY